MIHRIIPQSVRHRNVLLTSLLLASFAALLTYTSADAVHADEPLLAAFGERDITPEITEGKPVWLAGYGPGRQATGVHDPLFARCVVMRHGPQKIAMVTVDLVGLQYPEVKKIREKLPDYKYVVVSSTHNHEGPDVVGIWGRSVLQSGVDPRYLQLVVERIVEMVKAAESTLVEVRAAYGTAEDESLLGDSRQPIVFDGVLRTLKFTRTDNGRTAGLLVQWNCHPEALGSRNTLVTADFPFATVAALKKQYDCPVAYFSGAVGGLMAPPRDRVKDANGNILKEGDYEYARVYGEQVAALAARAVDAAAPIALTPFTISAKPIAVPVENTWYRAAHQIGVLRRDGRLWTGDFEKFGEPLTAADAEKTWAVETEVAYLRLGELHVACIPGEIYPELVYGKIQDPADPNADFPDAPREPSVVEILPGDKWLLLGLANDELGYIIPRRQWDAEPPFAYGRTKSQYGEINSCGPQVAPILMQALTQRVRAAANP
jgi:hypothetical protein